MSEFNRQKYWHKNLTYVGILLFIWFFVSFFCGILFAEPLNNFEILNIPLGFWFAQQGAIYVFVILIFTYMALMNRLDKEFGVNED
jgi:putative solute:sodium symporter small subunit